MRAHRPGFAGAADEADAADFAGAPAAAGFAAGAAGFGAAAALAAGAGAAPEHGHARARGRGRAPRPGPARPRRRAPQDAAAAGVRRPRPRGRRPCPSPSPARSSRRPSSRTARGGSSSGAPRRSPGTSSRGWPRCDGRARPASRRRRPRAGPRTPPDPVDPHQVSVVDPLQDQLSRDPRRGLDPGAPARRRAPLEELVRRVDAGIGQLLSVLGPDALDLGDVHPASRWTRWAARTPPDPVPRVYCRAHRTPGAGDAQPRRQRRLSRARGRSAGARRGAGAGRRSCRTSASPARRRTTARPPCR